jgi:8-oxo-dGTP pyrophosphatase MutT (NUDIX family)
MKFVQKVLSFGFWIGWPLFYLYFSRSTRTRILLIHNDRLLIVKNWLSSGHWSLPGGGIKRGEDPGIGAVRELYEETAINISATELTPLGKGFTSQYGIGFSFYAYFIILDKEVVTKRELIEVAEMRWEDIKKVRTQNPGNDLLATLELYDKFRTKKASA